jgi:hypothetical protein
VGEQNTKFFQAMATERYRRNAISSLKLSDGSDTSDHNPMAAVIWQTFKNRMGISKAITMGFDLCVLTECVDGLSSLSRPLPRKKWIWL